ncbi:MAG: hypothetical protein CM1200mP17_00600 [Woeseia sp.]|nr:MAG: hypothetical protein CM1200mP17_00600 [Woeseia sp.]
MVDPVIQIAGATSIPFGLDEMDFAGGLRGEAIEVVDWKQWIFKCPPILSGLLKVNFYPKEM